MMRKVTTFIGALVGGFLGWVFGTLADRTAAWATGDPAGDRNAFLLAFLFACVFSAVSWRIAGPLKARQTVAVEKVERAQLRASRTRVATGRTPPTPSPAFQA
jgi:hypothetical protein